VKTIQKFEDMDNLAGTFEVMEILQSIVACSDQEHKKRLVVWAISVYPTIIYDWLSLADTISGVDPFEVIKLCECVVADNPDIYNVKTFFRITMHVKASIILTRDARNKSLNNTSYLYLLTNGVNHKTKIGITTTPQKRHRTLSSYEDALKVTAIYSAPNSDTFKRIERELHRLLAPKRQRGEWFMLSEDDMANIENMLKTNGFTQQVSA